MDQPESGRQLLRHATATLAYRGGKAIRNARPDFATYQVGSARTPVQLVAHISDLLDWALSTAQGQEKWRNAQVQTWDEEVQRFFAALAAFDAFLTSAEPLRAPVENLFQGPIADALTHVGQIALLRRLANDPIKGENYYAAKISAGKVGAEQARPGFEFD